MVIRLFCLNRIFKCSVLLAVPRVAALERAQWVIEHYPQSPQVPEALATVAYSYDQLGDKQTAQQYTDVLKLNYPNLVKSNGEVNLRAGD
jgi:outer membrane protein assembly factor BamD